jgi:hypothetical protein
MLELLTTHRQRWRETRAEIRKAGLLQKDGDRRGGPQRTHALVKLARAEAVLIAKLCTSLGLTVTARNGIWIEPEPHEPSELERLMA